MSMQRVAVGPPGPDASVEVILGWLEDPRSDTGLDFARDDGTWERVSYAQLAGQVHATATWIASERAPGPAPVVIVLPTGPRFPAVFYGVQLAGATPCPLAPPMSLQSTESYVAYLATLLRTAQPSLVVTDETRQPVVEQALCSAQLPARARVVPPLAAAGGSERRPPAALALLQFTSGSTGRPRGGRVTWANLAANASIVRAWAQPRPDDLGVTFLPLFHDLGLIGTLLVSTSIGGQVRVMAPEQFVTDPLRWLSCFGRDGASVGGSPTFGFAYARRRIRDEALAGMDFSRWRMAMVGAERVDPAIIADFLAWLRPYGLRTSVFAPAYGLAEATLAVSACRLGEVARCVQPAWEGLRDGAPVELASTAQVDDRAQIGDGSGWLVSAGCPLPGVAVTSVATDGRPLPDGHLGELFVESPSIVDGYVGGARSGHTRFERGGLMTGDAGFVLDGEVFVCGRIGDSLNVRGRKVYAEDLEARLTCVPGIGMGRCVVLAGATGECEQVAVLVQGRPGDWVVPARRALQAIVGSEVRIDLFAVPRRTLLRTSSGKPRRRVMWQGYVAGNYDAFACDDAGGRRGKV